MQSWLDFWNRKHRIYVNDRHLAAHYRRIAEDLLALRREDEYDLLDWGCGSALAAPVLADQGMRVSLYDKAPAVQADLRARHGQDARIRLLDDAAMAALPDASYDLILVNSVVQYLSRAEFAGLLAELRRLLRPGARLIVADVISPDTGVIEDVRSLLASGARHGYFFAALVSLGATFFSDYRNLRSRLGLTTYREQDMLSMLVGAGLRARTLPHNIGFSSHRRAFEARRPEDR